MSLAKLRMVGVLVAAAGVTLSGSADVIDYQPGRRWYPVSREVPGYFGLPTALLRSHVCGSPVPDDGGGRLGAETADCKIAVVKLSGPGTGPGGHTTVGAPLVRPVGTDEVDVEWGFETLRFESLMPIEFGCGWWDMSLELDPTMPQPPGQARLFPTHAVGGSFVLSREVRLRFTLHRVGGPEEVELAVTVVLDAAGQWSLLPSTVLLPGETNLVLVSSPDGAVLELWGPCLFLPLASLDRESGPT
ncbi:MAG: hypothetical protein SF066_15075 [Thermoanaerobaculia bacterium]|nr:hypothetical protein [Thermoanaerobaculia bacterium]